MATYYFDSSALVKLYVDEPGSGWVDSVVTEPGPDGRPVNVIAMSAIGEVEVAAAMARRERQGQLDAGRRRQLLDTFLTDCGERFLTLTLPPDQLRRAVDLTQRRPLRGFDAVHLAAALDLEEQLLAAGLDGVRFVSADNVLCAAAQSEGFPVSNPINL